MLYYLTIYSTISCLKKYSKVKMPQFSKLPIEALTPMKAIDIFGNTKLMYLKSDLDEKRSIYSSYSNVKRIHSSADCFHMQDRSPSQNFVGKRQEGATYLLHYVDNSGCTSPLPVLF